jgi:MFS transporter, SP family, sugar:H+ symporter
VYVSVSLPPIGPTDSSQMYNDPDCKPWTSRSWVPEGYTSRYDLVKQTKATEMNKPLVNGADETRVEEVEKGVVGG